MKKAIAIILALIIVSLLSFGVCASSPDNVALTVTLKNDGSATVVAQWSGIYKSSVPIKVNTGELGGETVNILLNGQDGQYTRVTSDDRLAPGCFTLDESGIAYIPSADTGTVKMYLDIKDFVLSYDDYDGIAFALRPEWFGFESAAFTVNICTPDTVTLDTDDLSVWTPERETLVSIGEKMATVSTLKPVERGGALKTLIGVNKNIIYPVGIAGGSFNDVLAASYDNSDDGAGIVVFVSAFLLALILCGVLLTVILLRRNRVRRLIDSSPEYNGTPSCGRLNDSVWMARTFLSKDVDLRLPAVLLGLMSESGSIAVDRDKLTLISSPTSRHDGTGRMYEFLSRISSGSISKTALEEYCKEHPGLYAEMVWNIFNSGAGSLLARGCFVGLPSGSVKNLSDSGRGELVQIIGLRKYIENADSAKEFSPYALLFGMDEKASDTARVASEFASAFAPAQKSREYTAMRERL